MRNIFALITITLIFTSTAAFSRDLTFAWDANPVEEAIFEYDLEIFDIGTTTWVSQGTTSQLTLQLASFPETYTRCRVIAIDALGIRSGPSVELLIPATGSMPSAPTGFRVSLTPPP